MDPAPVGAAQAPQALCTRSGTTFVALEQVFCYDNPGGCPAPGGGSCGTCTSSLVH
jgi:hypothetical protein